MIERSVTHDTFAVERAYDSPPARVFAAWADHAAKTRWFGFSEGGGEHELDFRVGGREFSRGTGPGGRTFTFEGIYHDIVPDERIVYAYDMHMEEDRISVSLATVELRPDGEGTRLTYTEQGAFLDGLDVPKRRQEGMGTLLDALGEELGREPASA
jgi:uncharacterized protein YndB with AHSA1/START domain